MKRRFTLGRNSKGSAEAKPRRTDKKPLRPYRKKICHMCKERIAYVDFKDLNLMRKFVSERGKIRARRITGTCVRHQHAVAAAIKNAREVALLPYVVK